MDPAAPAAPVVEESVKKAVKAVKKATPRKAVAQDTGATAPVRSRVRKARRQPWVEPLGTATPTTHPVKAKLSSMLYHLPGMAFYDRTRPDRCYVDAEAAEADGFNRSKR